MMLSKGLVLPSIFVYSIQGFCPIFPTSTSITFGRTTSKGCFVVYLINIIFSCPQDTVNPGEDTPVYCCQGHRWLKIYTSISLNSLNVR